MKTLTKEEINLIITILTNFLMNKEGKYEEFKLIETIIEKLSEN